MEGWISLYRCLLGKPIWKKSTPEQKSILITLLLMVNHRENEWEWKGEQFRVQPGQMITSLESIVEEAGKGISIQNVRTALARFEKLQFLTNESTKTGRLITIVNWHLYQQEIKETNKEDNKDLTKRSQRPNKDLTPNNNDNNDNNEISNIFSHWNSKKIIEHRQLNDKTKRAINGAFKDYSQDEINQAINNYAFILRSESHYFSYKWSLKDFIERGLEKFMDLDTADQNYRNKKGGDTDEPTGGNSTSKYAHLTKNGGDH